MKKVMKSGIMMLMAILVTCSLVACGGLDMKKVEGTWGLSMVDGMSYDDYCAAQGADPATSNSIWEITEKAVTVTGNGATQNYKVDIKSDGFELLDDNNTIFLSIRYNEKDSTLSYKVNDGQKDIEMVLSRDAAE